MKKYTYHLLQIFLVACSSVKDSKKHSDTLDSDSEGLSEDSSGLDSVCCDTSVGDTSFEDGLDDKYYRSSTKDGYAQITSSSTFTCALDSGGYAECWGYEHEKRFGHLDVPKNLQFQKISAGARHGCGILSENGGIVCWGDNTYHQSEGPPEGYGPFMDIATGFYNSCGVNFQGTIVCWGEALRDHQFQGKMINLDSGYSGFCAVREDNTHFCAGVMRSKTPHNRRFASVTVSWNPTYEFACGITLNHEIECWNDLNDRGEQLSYTRYPEGYTFTQISAGYSHTCGITETGEGFCWGSGIYDPPSSVQFTKIESGADFACGLDTTGRIYCWGEDEYGQITPP